MSSVLTWNCVSISLFMINQEDLQFTPWQHHFITIISDHGKLLLVPNAICTCNKFFLDHMSNFWDTREDAGWPQKWVRQLYTHTSNQSNLNEEIWMKSDFFGSLQFAKLHDLYFRGSLLEMNKRIPKTQWVFFLLFFIHSKLKIQSLVILLAKHLSSRVSCKLTYKKANSKYVGVKVRLPSL